MEKIVLLGVVFVLAALVGAASFFVGMWTSKFWRRHHPFMIAPGAWMLPEQATMPPPPDAFIGFDLARDICYTVEVRGTEMIARWPDEDSEAAMAVRLMADEIMARCESQADIGIGWRRGSSWVYGRSCDPEVRSMSLLRDWLSESQRAEFGKTGRFTVIGNESGTRYEISTKASYNVRVERGANIVMDYCFEPDGGLPTGDRLLGQKIGLECAESVCLDAANYRKFERQRNGEMRMVASRVNGQTHEYVLPQGLTDHRRVP